MMTSSVSIERIERVCRSIEPPDVAWAERAAARQACLTMPRGSLGRLLEVGRQLASLQRTDRPRGSPALAAVLAADHGVAEAGVSAYPREVTAQMVANYQSGGAALNVLAARAGAAVRVAELGVAGSIPHVSTSSRLVSTRTSRPVRAGTSNWLEGPAMSRDEAFQAFATGLDLADLWLDETSAVVVALGEMGIGNSTTSAALLATMLDREAGDVVGRGTGVDDEGLARKRAAVARGLALHHHDAVDLWDRAARLGGFEIIGLAGLAVGAASRHTLVVLDGLISTTAGLLATRICPPVRDFLLAAHLGPEPGHALALDALRLDPLLRLDLRLGEASGAALALPIVAAAADILRDMASFESAGVSDLETAS